MRPALAIVIPAFAYPEHAARALRRAADYGRWRRRPPPKGDFRVRGVDRDAARGLISQALHGRPQGCWLDAQTAEALLGCYGIGSAPAVVVNSADAALREAERIGYPVALKVADPEVVHKPDIGGVRLDLADASALRQAYEAMVEALPQPATGLSCSAWRRRVSR
jgi:acyl-CoA synthetase (NDP forming)